MIPPPLAATWLLLLLAALSGLTAGAARAQQTLFNDPSADVLGRHELYLELDVSHRFHQGFEGITPRVVWGPGGGAELGMNVGPFLEDRQVGGERRVSPNAKVRLFSSNLAGNEVSAIGGTRVHVPVAPGSVLLEGYAFLAYRTDFGLRVTTGVYGETPMPKVGAIVTVEMVLGPHFTVAAEWWQRRDLGIGPIVPLPNGFTLYAAYLLSPAGRQGDGIIIEIGKLF